MENTSIHVVCNLRLSVESAHAGEGLASASGHCHVLVDTKFVSPFESEFFVSVETVGFSVLTFLELEGHDSHSQQVGAMDSFIALGNDNLDSL